MLNSMRSFTPLFLVFFTLCFVEAGIMAEYSDARSRGGGRSFRSTPAKKAPVSQNQKAADRQKSAGMGKGLMGGLLGGAIGGMLLGSMFGMGGTGMGILPFLLLGVVGYFLYRRISTAPSQAGPAQGYQAPASSDSITTQPSVPVKTELEEGLERIRVADSGFDTDYFVQVASDVFFQVQAGWIRRDIASYRNLLGDELAAEYEIRFTEMVSKGERNMLENISIRKVDIIAAGSENGEDFVTVLFTANLLDYTVDDSTGECISGSMTEPVKFAEEWSWARPIGTQEWKLEGIKER